MHQRHLTKPDGRYLILYGREPVPELEAPSPGAAAVGRASHLRWHPLLGEWIVYAGHRQTRTFLPADHDPLAPATDPAHPTEVPAGPWDVAVFENLFPALGRIAPELPRAIVDTAAARGRCEVVVFTQEARGSLGELPLDHVELVVDVWADRWRALAASDDVAYVLAFENRGVEVGVTLHHPHGQIYAYPFVPSIPARTLAREAEHHARVGRGLLEDHLRAELDEGTRTLYAGDHAVAIVPVCARWAYEVWIAPRRRAPTLGALDAAERRDVARALKTVLLKLDGLWGVPMPYVLAVYQAPTRGEHPYAHARIEIYPWYRMRGRLKYLAGSEVAAGAFTADTLPEEKAAELRAVEVSLG